MKCPQCKSLQDKVIDSKWKDNIIDYNKRRRECSACGFRWNTREYNEDYIKEIPAVESSNL